MSILVDQVRCHKEVIAVTQAAEVAQVLVAELHRR